MDKFYIKEVIPAFEGHLERHRYVQLDDVGCLSLISNASEANRFDFATARYIAALMKDNDSLRCNGDEPCSKFYICCEQLV